MGSKKVNHTDREKRSHILSGESKMAQDWIETYFLVLSRFARTNALILLEDYRWSKCETTYIHPGFLRISVPLLFSQNGTSQINSLKSIRMEYSANRKAKSRKFSRIAMTSSPPKKKKKYIQKKPNKKCQKICNVTNGNMWFHTLMASLCVMWCG